LTLYYSPYRLSPTLHPFPTRRSSDLSQNAGHSPKLWHTLLQYPATSPEFRNKHALPAQSLFTMHCSPTRAFVVATHCFMLHQARSEEHTSELQSRVDLVCRLLLEKKK